MLMRICGALWVLLVVLCVAQVVLAGEAPKVAPEPEQPKPAPKPDQPAGPPAEKPAEKPVAPAEKPVAPAEKPAAPNPPTEEELYAKAKALKAEGKLAEAAAVLEQLLRDHPGNLAAKMQVESIRKQMKADLEKQQERKTAAEAGKPGEADQLEQARLQAGKAKMETEIAEAREKERTATAFQQALALYRKGEYVRAKGLLEDVPADSPYADQVNLLRKAVDDKVAQADKEAAQALAQAKQEKREMYDLYVAARRDYWKKQFDPAIAKCGQILEKDPTNAKARALLHDARMAKAQVEINEKMFDQDVAAQQANIETVETATVPKRPAPTERPAPVTFFNPREYDTKPLEEKLNQIISVNLEATPLEYLLDIVFRATGVSIITDPAAVEGKTLTVHVENITLGELIDYITRNLGMQFTMGRDAIWITTPETPMMTYRIFPLKQGLTDVTSEDPPTENSDLEKLFEKIPTLIEWPTGSEFHLDRKNNVLIVRSTPEVLKDVEALVNVVDAEGPQVLIEAKFIEVDATAFDDLGVDLSTKDNWSLLDKNGLDKLHIDAGLGASLPEHRAGSPTDFPDVTSDSGFSFTLTGVLTDPKFQMVLKTLRARTNTITLSEPKLLTMSNSTAEMEITRDLWYVESFTVDRSNLSGTSIGGYNNMSSLQQLLQGTTGTIPSGINSLSEPVIIPEYTQGDPTGFTLKITPSVGADRRSVTLVIEPEIREEILPRLSKTIVFPGITSGQTTEVERPVISTRSLITKMILSDGCWVVTGGLVGTTKEHLVTKVPILGDVPLIKYLFRRTTDRDVKRNLLIFVRASVIDPKGNSYVDAGDVRAARAEATRTKASDVEVLLEKNLTSKP